VKSWALLASRAGSREVSKTLRCWRVGSGLGRFWPRERNCGQRGSLVVGGLVHVSGASGLESNCRKQGSLEVGVWPGSRALLASRIQLRAAGKSKSWRLSRGLGRFWPREQMQAARKSS